VGKENILNYFKPSPPSADTITVLPRIKNAKKRALEEGEEREERERERESNNIGPVGNSARMVGRVNRRKGNVNSNGGREGLVDAATTPTPTPNPQRDNKIENKQQELYNVAGTEEGEEREREEEEEEEEQDKGRSAFDSTIIVTQRAFLLDKDTQSTSGTQEQAPQSLALDLTTPIQAPLSQPSSIWVHTSQTPLSWARESPQNENASGTNTGTSTPHVLRSGKPRIIIRHNRNKGKSATDRGISGKIGIGIGTGPELGLGTAASGEVVQDQENSGGGTVCVSTLLRQEDFDIMPSLESALRKEAKRRMSESGPGRKMQNKPLANGYTKGANGTSSSSSASSVTNGQPDGKASKHDKPLERNIDNIIFGDVTFKAWYPSWYPKEIIGDSALRGEGRGIVVPELYVCKRCFGYGKVLVEWVRHCRCCEKGIPGGRIYSHGVGRGGHEATWSVWEVDGSVDTVSYFVFLFITRANLNSSSVKTSPYSQSSSWTINPFSLMFKVSTTSCWSIPHPRPLLLLAPNRLLASSRKKRCPGITTT
jgi:hypothetical protein